MEKLYLAQTGVTDRGSRPFLASRLGNNFFWFIVRSGIRNENQPDSG
jgi:hypothetical protein